LFIYGRFYISEGKVQLKKVSLEVKCLFCDNPQSFLMGFWDSLFIFLLFFILLCWLSAADLCILNGLTKLYSNLIGVLNGCINTNCLFYSSKDFHEVIPF
jgi:hypothetical protein